MAEQKKDIEDEYDFSAGERGCYAERFRAGSNVVVLDPDVARRFKTSEEVNEALRHLEKKGSASVGGKS